MSRYAVVVGINRYVGFNALNHAVNDALAVESWLLDRGGVPAAQLTRIASGPALDPADPRPLAHEILRAIARWREDARRRVADGTLDWEATRLYVYVSGHGLAPTPDDAALLAADATRFNTPSVSLKEIRDFLVRSQEFREVVLIADCCRDDIPGAPSLPPPWTRVPSPNREPVRHLFWRATAFNTQSFEAPEAVAHPEEEHGYFTRALLAGLRGEAEHRGVIDAVSLADWLEREVPRILPEGRRQRPEVPPNSISDPIVFWRSPAAQPAPAPATGDVEVEVRSGAGVAITVRDANGEIVAMGKVRLVTTLAPGAYTFVFRDGAGERTVARQVIGATEIADTVEPASIVPFPGSAGQNETHEAAAEELAKGVGGGGGPPTGLVVVVRLRRDDVSPVIPTLGGLTFRGKPLSIDRRVPEVGLPRLVGASVSSPAGPWPLGFPGRLLADGSSGPSRSLPLTLHPGWITCVFAPPDAHGRATIEGASIHMRRPWAADPPEANLAAEYALDAVTRGVPGISRRDLDRMLYGKWENPVLGLLGAHLLLLEEKVRWKLVGEVLANLGRLLPGSPDLAGLQGIASRRWTERPGPAELAPPPPPAPVSDLPMLWRSWEGLLWLDQRNPGFLVRNSDAERSAAAVTAAGPWLAVTHGGPAAFLEAFSEVSDGVRERVLGWAEAAGTSDPVEVAAGTRMPVRVVREVLARAGD